MLWLKRWNFIERAKLERELWEAFERGESIEALLEACPADDLFRREVWSTTVVRIRRIEALMAGKGPTSAGAAAEDPNVSR
ncbi:hypothetical protein [Cyanobium sp. ATX 6F1]|uniref:hypothetical protein n=1 Tax=Cyanobium sp. ATX 6F1 TaxID=2823702 RepID=UPI0020CF5CC9|nr:hypothetical protein [Cyanobium sp. ATX 6F1]